MKRYGKFITALIAAILFSQSIYAEGVLSDGSESDAVLVTEAAPEISYSPMEITETYNYDYELYEEVMNNRFVFYATVGNGGITDKPVSVELPKNVQCEMEKDGEEVLFTNRAEISEIGSYTLNLLVDSRDVYGAEENTVYYGLFRFKIVEARAEETTAEATTEIAENPPETTETESDKDGEYVVSETEATTTVSAPLITTAQSIVTTEPTDAETTLSTTETVPENPDKPLGDSKLITETASELMTGFELTTKGGAQFTSNIPMGMTTTGSVSISLSTDTMTAVFLDGEEIESADTYTVSGKYEIYFYDGSSEPLPLYSFEIIDELNNTIESYSVPNGCIIAFAALDGRQIATAASSVKTEKDGNYSFIVTKGAYSATVTLTRDTVPPEISVSGVNENNVADSDSVEIEVVSGDMDSFSVTRDGNPYAATSLTFAENGEYTATIYDKAGNSVSAEFTIPYAMNIMGVLIIIILALLVAGIIGYVLYSRRHFKIK